MCFLVKVVWPVHSLNTNRPALDLLCTVVFEYWQGSAWHMPYAVLPYFSQVAMALE